MDLPTAIMLAAVLAVVPVIRHLRYRRQLLLEVRLRNFQVPPSRPQRRTAPMTAVPKADRAAPPPIAPPGPAVETAPPAPAVPERAVLYVDATGRCTLADDAARALLQWTSGELSLADVVAGGVPEAADLLATLARHGSIEAHATRLRTPHGVPVDLTAVAVRDRDDNLWGAAFFIHGARTLATDA